jgi:predicted kinase
VPPPTLIVISGPPGAGKTTLAHALATAVGCPAICRDEIKEGMLQALPGFVAGPGDALTARASRTFFAVLDVLLGNGVTLVAEAAFQDRVWRPELERLGGGAELRIVQCVLDPAIARARVQERMAVASRSAHADAALLASSSPAFVPITLAVPTLHVDTSAGYRPSLEEIAAFARGRGV